jgi:hypothetical protein
VAAPPANWSMNPRETRGGRLDSSGGVACQCRRPWCVGGGIDPPGRGRGRGGHGRAGASCRDSLENRTSLRCVCFPGRLLALHARSVRVHATRRVLRHPRRKAHTSQRGTVSSRRCRRGRHRGGSSECRRSGSRTPPPAVRRASTALRCPNVRRGHTDLGTPCDPVPETTLRIRKVAAPLRTPASRSRCARSLARSLRGGSGVSPRTETYVVGVSSTTRAPTSKSWGRPSRRPGGGGMACHSSMLG